VVLRVVVGIACYAQRCEALGQRVALAGNLDLTLGALSAATRNDPGDRR
jgi:hypothetical protein